jgi:4-hydroxybenzoate polyprenyltransferase
MAGRQRSLYGGASYGNPARSVASTPMQRFAEKLLTAFQLTRLSLVFGAIADVWFVVIYTRNDTRYDLLPVFEMPLAIDLVTAALLAIGLFAFATSLNDLLDLRHDAAFSPDRPLPAGRIRAGQAVVITIGALLLAIAAAIPFGTGGLVLAVLAATAALFYNAAGKHLPAIGVITAGLVHVAHMLVPNHEMAFMLPVWLIFTHVLVTSVIGYQLEGKRPQLTGLGFAGILIGWGFWSIVILGIAARRDPMQYFLPGELGLENLIWPALAVIAFIAIAWRKVGPVGGTLGAEKLRRYGAMWHGVYAAAWFAALGLWPACLLMTVFTIVGIASMTLLKELTSTDPGMVGYRV